MMGVTPLMAQLLGFISARIRDDGIAPSFDEMAAEIGASKSNVHRLVVCLEERGRIRRLRGRARAIEVVR